MVQSNNLKSNSLSVAQNLRSLYDVKISTELTSTEWDTFIQKTPAGHHVQSSLWASLKKTHGWDVARVIVSKNAQILAGAQFLTKSIPIFGKVAYLQQGPVVSEDTPLTDTHLFEMIDLCMRETGIRLSFIIPPRNGQSFVKYLESRSLVPHQTTLVVNATTMVDLTPDLDTILSNMKSKTRYNIRYAGRKGITVHEVGRKELPKFHEMLKKTADRNEFEPYSLEYFEKMYDLFSENDHFRLIFAKHEDEVVSSILLIAYGDTVIYKKGGWSGEKGNLRPNEALHWDAINWSKENGYRYYDFEGIMEDAARAALAGEDIPNHAMNTYSRFKLGFGGDVLILPKAYLYSPNPLLNWFAQQNELISNGIKLARKFR